MPKTKCRKFTDRPITHSTAHHLTTTAQLLSSSGYARVSDIAQSLGLTRGSVSVTMKGLCSSGYVKQDSNHFFHLTPKGDRAVRSLVIRYEVMRHFLVQNLGLQPSAARKQSCQVAYLLTAPTTRRLAALTRNIEAETARLDVHDEAFNCPFGYEGCDSSNGATEIHCPCCGMDCLKEWLPANSNQLPCKENIYA